MRDKLNNFVSILAQKRSIKFYLYNVTYIIYTKNDKYIIRQLNSNIEYVYDDLKLLFENYRIYGQSILECFDSVFIFND